MTTYYYVCDSCAHVMPWPDDVGEAPGECENCGNQSQSGPFDLDTAEEVSELRTANRGYADTVGGQVWDAAFGVYVDP